MIYFKDQQQKLIWLDAIKKAVSYTNIEDFYEVGEIIGQGKYGVVKKAVHKKTGQEVAVKIVNKQEMPVKDHELL